MVVAESIAAAKDAAERVTVDYEPLQPVTETAGARRSRSAAALRSHRQCLHRCRCRRRRGDQGGVRARGACGEVRDLGAARHRRAARRPRRGRRLRSGDEQAHAACRLRRRGAAEARACRRSSASEPDVVRVECGDVGGNFGTRNAFYPEFALVVWAAKRLGRPVKWTCERSEAFASDYQGRDQAITPSLRSTTRAGSSRCAARSSATPARTASCSCRW